jgi:Fe-S-cluster containining protein
MYAWTECRKMNRTLSNAGYNMKRIIAVNDNLISLTNEAIDEYVCRLQSLLELGTSIVDFIAELYRITDEILDKYVNNKTCSQGCYYCCNTPVAVTGVEAEYIAHNTGYKIVSMANAKMKKHSRPGYCPFLREGECSIYEFRPMACRVFTSFDDVSLCKKNLPHRQLLIAPVGEGGIDLLNHFYYQLAVNSAELIPRLGVIKDLRHYFQLPVGSIK